MNIGLLYSFLFSLVLLSMKTASAQLTISGQVRPRTEYRNGAGTLRLKDNAPSFFVSQRSRLTFKYKMNHVIVQTSLQDVRVWGQDASTFSTTDGSKLELHEGWAEIAMADKTDSTFKHSTVDYFAIKIGRQELVYDDQRLLGNLDWLQQARRHDAIIFKLKQKDWAADLGMAFNQNTDAFNYNGTYYTPANVVPYVKDSKGQLTQTPANFIPLVNAAGWSSKTGSPAIQTVASSNGLYQDYKALQYLHISKTTSKAKLSGLIVADYFSKYRSDSVRNVSGGDVGYLYGKSFNEKGVSTRVTSGVYLNSFIGKQNQFIIMAEYYYQTGRDRDAHKIGADLGSVSLAYAPNRFSYSAGWDYTSGNDAFSTSTTDHRFDPLYGTPHKFWGLMDYFYVSTGAPAGGLSNPYAKIKYNSTNKRFAVGVDYQYFALANDQKDVNNKAIKTYLGSEIDLVADYSLNKITSVQCGFSVMNATHSMEYAKNLAPGSAKLTGYWSFLMITIKPEFIFK